jgi:AcrR family transcriptional regulator
MAADGVGSIRPGGRTARTRAAVAAAMQAELLEVGYGGTTIDRIAKRAGVAKTTVYRRWGNVSQLVVDMFADAASTQIPVADTGSIEGDLRELARSSVALLLNPVNRAIFDIVVSEAVHNPSARDTLTTFFAARIENAAAIVQRAVDRGEIPAGTDAGEVIRLVGAPYFARLYITGDPIGMEDADRGAAVVALAARSGLLRTAR